MKYVVVDTDVFSRLYRGLHRDQYRQPLTDAVPVLSFASVAELHYGVAVANWGERRRKSLEEAIRSELQNRPMTYGSVPQLFIITPHC